MCIILTGYGAGILHKFFYNYDAVIWLYGLNCLMVGADMVLYFRNGALMREAAASCEEVCMEQVLHT